MCIIIKLNKHTVLLTSKHRRVRNMRREITKLVMMPLCECLRVGVVVIRFIMDLGERDGNIQAVV